MTASTAFAFPPDIVTALLPFVAESIRRAHELAPEKWGVTPKDGWLRLNLGRIEVLTVSGTRMRVVVDAATAPGDLELAGGYASVPGSQVTVVPVSHAAAVLPRLRRSHDELLQHASKGSFNPGSRRGHRNWAVDEIARLVGVHLPLPAREDSEGALLQDAGDVQGDARYLEGGVKDVVLTRHERNPRARAACIAHYGTACLACGMRFSEVYGPEMSDAIHVHHLAPVAAAAGEYDVDPIRDLVPLCPNCHTAVHQTNPPRTIEELKSLFNKRS